MAGPLPPEPPPPALDPTVPLDELPTELFGPTGAAGAPPDPGTRPRLHPLHTGVPQPRDPAEAAVDRMQFALAAAATALLLGVLTLPFVQPNVGGVRDGLSRPFWTMPIGLALTAGAWFVARNRALPAARRLDLGLAYLVVASALVGLFTHWLPYDNQLDVVRGPSAVAVMVLLSAVLVPAPPRRMAAALGLAALMDPLTLAATCGLGNPVPRPGLWLWLFLPTVASAVVALAAASWVHGLGQQLAEARRLGAYRLGERLGAGGMGEVWTAEHSRLARPATVKLIRSEQLAMRPEDAQTARLRFVREARITARLQSPHTIEVYDFGVARDGALYYVMELLDGVDLDALVRAHGALPPERVVHLLLQACDSLGEAHEHGLVHRDVKPANLYVCRRGQQVDVLKVLDFGIVQLQEPDAELTAEHAISGTPAYLAPEAATGMELDGRADIYALGCVAFFALTGRLVFPAETSLAMVLAHVRAEPPRPSAFADVPAALDELIVACLSKAPADRPATCTDLAERLRATRVDGWTQQRARAWWREHRSPPGT